MELDCGYSPEKCSQNLFFKMADIWVLHVHSLKWHKLLQHCWLNNAVTTLFAWLINLVDNIVHSWQHNIVHSWQHNWLFTVGSTTLFDTVSSTTLFTVNSTTLFTVSSTTLFTVSSTTLFTVNSLYKVGRFITCI